MAYFAIIGDVTTRDLLSSARIEVGPGPGKPTLRLPDMTSKVEVFVDDKNALFSGLESSWPGINTKYRLNAKNDGIEERP